MSLKLIQLTQHNVVNSHKILFRGWDLGRRPVYRRVGSGKETISVAIDKIKLHYWSKYWITLKISRHCDTYLRVLHNYMYIE